MTRRLVVLLLIGAAATADVKMDDATRKLFEAWRKKEHNLQGQGLAKVSFKIKATLTQPAAATTGTFSWTKDKTELTWKSRFIGRLLASRTLDEHALAESYADRPLAQRFRGCTLTSAKDGERTVVTVKGDTPTRIRTIVFDKRGVPVEHVIGGATHVAPGNRHFRVRLTYEERKGRFVLKSREYEFRLPAGQGILETHVHYSYKEVNGLWVLSEIRQTDRRGNTVESEITLEFSDHKIERKKKDG